MSESSNPIIVAIASPPGRSLRGIIRMSGPGVFDLLQHNLSMNEEAASEEPLVAHNRAARSIGDEDEGHVDTQNTASRHSNILKNVGMSPTRGFQRATFALRSSDHTRTLPLPCLAFIFPGPHSYTGEDSVELQLPGNPILLQRVIDDLLLTASQLNIPARRAEPGEFTARAFLNGRLSLTQAEGVQATIAAQSDAELRAAQLLTSGSLGDFARRIADELASALALVEAGIDFTDQEDVVAIAPNDLHRRLLSMHGELLGHLSRAVGFEQLQAIPWVVLVGEPNAGKSALFNALLGRERAIVSPTAGTTRDVLAEPLTIQTDHGPAEVMLVDLAGLDDADGSSINRMMQERARETIDRAELLIHCVPIQPSRNDADSLSLFKGEGWGEGLDARQRLIERTNIDCAPSPSPPAPLPRGGRGEWLTVHTKNDLAARGVARPDLSVSAITGEGLHELRAAIAQRLNDRAVSLAADAVALRPRHEAALRQSLDHLHRAIKLVAPQQDQRSLDRPEEIASCMRLSLDDLATLAGDISPDDVLGRVFATFCVGK